MCSPVDRRDVSSSWMPPQPESSSPTATGQLRVIGASTEQVQLLELFQIQNDEGPCLDCYHSPVTSSSTPTSTPVAVAAVRGRKRRAGFPSVCAIPLRLQDLVLGCLNLFMSEPGRAVGAEIALAQALADVASIAIVQDQATRDAAIREGHLQHALNSRIAIEQAKGMIAERNVDMDEAFSRLRAYARNNNRGLTEVAEALVMGALDVDAIGPASPPPATTSRASLTQAAVGRRWMYGRQPAASVGVDGLAQLGD